MKVGNDLSMIDSQHPTRMEDNTVAVDTLPPRHSKHGRRKSDDEQHEMVESKAKDNIKNKSKSFLYIQIILYTFLALIAAIIILYYANDQRIDKVSDEPIDPMENFLQKQAQNGTPSVGNLEPDSSQKEESTNVTQDNKNQEIDITKDVPDLVRSEQKKDYTENGYNETSEERDRVEEPPQSSTPSSTDPNIRLEHTVQSGETLYSITMRYYKSKTHLDYLAKFNGIKDPTTDIRVGMKLKIPEIAN